jgi:outer membrane biogenesis lipoprotein LolB
MHTDTDAMLRAAVLAIVLALLMPTDAQAQQRTIYGSDGRVQSRTHTDTQGSVTIYGADGKVQSRSSIDSSDTVTIYFGRAKTGSVTVTPKPHQGK